MIAQSLELNKIYNMDCVEGMKLLPDNSIDLTVTSPPYDNLRTYTTISINGVLINSKILQRNYIG